MKISTVATALSLALGITAGAQTKIVIKGSDTLGAKMVAQLAEAYKAAGNSVDFEIAAEGSSTAFTNLLAGTCQLGMSSRDAKDSEKDRFTAAGKDLVEHVAAWDMIAVIVNDANGIRNLKLKQIASEVAKLVSQLIEERDGSAIPLIQLLFVMRSLERIGDLAVNVGEEVVFIESAEDIRHQSCH
jgi:ABC-type phosphate transport system substrate-binding protein